MSDSTIDDALRLLEIGKGNKERLNKIIEGFEKRSLIQLQDRKYVEALVQQYLTPRHRIKIKKIEPVKKQPSITQELSSPQNQNLILKRIIIHPVRKQILENQNLIIQQNKFA